MPVPLATFMYEMMELMQLSSWVLFRVLPNSSTMALNTCAY